MSYSPKGCVFRDVLSVAFQLLCNGFLRINAITKLIFTDLLGIEFVYTCACYSSLQEVSIYRVEPRYNDLRYNDIPDITMKMLCPGSCSKMYGTE